VSVRERYAERGVRDPPQTRDRSGLHELRLRGLDEHELLARHTTTTD
jgi:hypothetical protein